VSTPAIGVDNAGKRYVKYDDTPMLVTRIARFRTRTKRSPLWAIRGCSFDVADGEIVGIIGRNGSGKSTLLRMLAGVTAPTEGSVAVRGRVAPLIAVGVGFHQELTGRENVYINGTVLGLTRKEIDRRFDEIVDFAEIEPFIDTPVKFYSSGMFVRLGFAVSVLADPDVLIVDEVLAVGDIAFQIKCMDRMLEIQHAGTTIVVVSHNLSAIRNMCRRTLVLHDGELRYDGGTGDAISLYHDLLGEFRELEGASAAVHAGEGFDPRAVVERFELLNSEGRQTNHVRSGEEVTFTVDFRFEKATESPLLGLSVLNEAGVHVYGESTAWLGGPSYRAGERVHASIRLKPSLVTGSYSGGVSLVSQTGVTLAPAVRPILFYVGGRHAVSGVADLAATFEVERVAIETEKTG
jgi:ABC-type polysaccharide/polyol phosphate transport system ATPase subunit